MPLSLGLHVVLDSQNKMFEVCRLSFKIINVFDVKFDNLAYSIF